MLAGRTAVAAFRRGSAALAAARQASTQSEVDALNAVRLNAASWGMRFRE